MFVKTKPLFTPQRITIHCFALLKNFQRLVLTVKSLNICRTVQGPLCVNHTPGEKPFEKFQNASIGKWVSKSFNSLSNKEKLEKIVLADFLMH